MKTTMVSWVSSVRLGNKQGCSPLSLCSFGDAETHTNLSQLCVAKKAKIRMRTPLFCSEPNTTYP
jgi:hypothetical protein